jgi:hypothetical protein
MSGQLGLDVIPHGLVKDLDYPELVVYENQWAHAGNQKFKLTREQALDRDYGHNLASKFIDTGPVTTSYKVLYLGIWEFRLKISCPDDWRTNHGTPDIDILETIYNPIQSFRAVWAYDYILDGDKPLAIDLNYAPGCRNLGIKDLLSGPETAKSICEWYKLHGF